MVAKDRITINLGDRECQALVALSRQFDVSPAWTDRRALSDPTKRYSLTEIRLLVLATFPKESRGSA